MKQKDKLISSIIIAFVAGFIYYAFADFDTLKRIPLVALETINSVIDNKSNDEYNPSDIRYTKSNENKIADNKDITIPELNTLENGLAQMSEADFGMYGKFNESLFAQIPSLEKLNRLQHFDVPDYENFANLVRVSNFDNYGVLDSHRAKIKIKISGLDSLNINLDESMAKLNESLSKLNETLLSEDFLKSLPQLDSEHFKDLAKLKDLEGLKDLENLKDLEDLKELDKLKELKIDIDVEKLQKEINENIKENMKDFKENMKDFKIDMEQFKDSMKQFKENMKDLKKEFKTIDSVKNKRIEFKEVEIES